MWIELLMGQENLWKSMKFEGFMEMNERMLVVVVLSGLEVIVLYLAQGLQVLTRPRAMDF
jgi:hypothetical protein